MNGRRYCYAELRNKGQNDTPGASGQSTGDTNTNGAVGASNEQRSTVH